MGRRGRIAKSTQRYLDFTAKSEWRTALYARLSCENNGLEDPRSLDNQVRYVEEYIRQRPELGPAGKYVDNGQSGLSFDRPEFQRMMEDARSGKINCIVVKDLSRFGRNHVEAGYYIEKLFPFLNVRFISINDNYDSMDTSTKNNLTVPLKNMVNEMYAKDIGKKITATVRMNQRKGKAGICLAPYGYLKDPECSYHLVPDPETAGNVRLIFRLAAEGTGISEIAAKLDALGAVTPSARKAQTGVKTGGYGTDGKWARNTIYAILASREYLGEMVYNDVYGKGELMSFPNAHEPLVDEETFERVQEIRNAGRRKKKAEICANAENLKKHPNVLQGKFYCAECGAAMAYLRAEKGGSMHRSSYRCRNYEKIKAASPDAPECCRTSHTISDHLVRKTVLDQIRRQLLAGLELESLKAQLARERKKKKGAGSLAEEETILKDRLHRLYEDFAEGRIKEEAYTEERLGLLEQLGAVREKIAATESKTEKKDGPDPWTELKTALFKETGGDENGVIHLTESSTVEIVEDEIEADEGNELVQRLLRKGLTRELVDVLIKRVEYGTDGSLSITFACEDYVQKLIAERSGL